MLTITVGEGRDRPQGKRVVIDGSSPAEALVKALYALPSTKEAWWSGHVWQGDYREERRWESACAAVVDIDWRWRESSPTPDVVQLVEEVIRVGALPGSCAHLTPHGFRVAFAFPEDVHDRELVAAAGRGAGARVNAFLKEAKLIEWYRVDAAILDDLARFYYGPNAFAKGIQRHAEVKFLWLKSITPAELAADDPGERRVTALPRRDSVPVAQAVLGAVPRLPVSDIDEAAHRWNADHPGSWPRSDGECPVCGHRGCFGRMPDDPQRWVCMSTDHTPGVGVAGKGCWHGDALDIEAHAAGKTRVHVLRATGYLAAKKREPRRPTVIDGGSTPPRRPLRNRSYLTAVTILRDNLKDVLEGRQLALNEMTGRVELGGESIDDTDVTVLRARIELLFQGGEDKNGNPTGLALSKADVCDAIDQVAAERRYHPVRQYLESLSWDGIRRLDDLVEYVLQATKTEFTVKLVRRFFISAVTRVLRPGCKVDTVLVLVGEQGCGKSSFLRILAEPWFVDTAVDIHDKDSFQVLRRAWIYEWAELEVLRRAKDAAAAKAFLSSQTDTYRPPYGRKVVDVPRSGVIAGSTNNVEFLSDDTGNRRFWPLEVGEVDLELLQKWKDQLWAEARTAAVGGEPYWLSREEGRALSTSQEQHLVRDAWEGAVLSYAEVKAGNLTIPDILADAIGKPRGQWGKADEMRVSSILKRAGYARRRVGYGKSPSWSKTRS